MKNKTLHLVSFALSFTCLLTPSFANQTVYKWVDSNGELHFSDQPHSGAKKIEVQEVQTVEQLPIPEGATSNTPGVNPTANTSYQTLQITYPTDQLTIKNNSGTIALNYTIQPKLKKGDKIQLIFDGKKAGTPQSSKMFKLKNVFRGSHTVSLQVVDKEKKVLITSSSVTFFMQRPLVSQNPNYKKTTQRLPSYTH
jgi:hypothetical protein